jgi:hypothetical protein
MNEDVYIILYKQTYTMSISVLCGVHYTINDDVLTRLGTVHFSRFYNCEGGIENIGCGNTEHRGIRAVPGSHLIQISWKRGMGSMFFFTLMVA